jgi:hypothetical protein
VYTLLFIRNYLSSVLLAQRKSRRNDFGGQAMKIGILNAGNIDGTLAKAWGG